jgi:tetratricopeptide (TPR) repeat protein
MDVRDGDQRWRMWAEAELASYAMVRGRLEDGTAGILRSYDLQDEVGTRFIEIPRPLFEAMGTANIRLHFLQDPEGAARILDQALADPEVEETDPEFRAHLAFAELYAQAGLPDRGGERLEAYTEEVSEEIRGEDGRLSYQRAAEAAVALAEGDAPEAIRLYRESRSLAPKCDFCGMPGLGEAYEAAAQPDSAVAVYQEYLDAKVLFRSQTDNVNLHRVLLGLARSYEALGDNERAAEHYGRVLGLWSGADSALNPRVQEIRRKLMFISEEGPS